MATTTSSWRSGASTRSSSRCRPPRTPIERHRLHASSAQQVALTQVLEERLGVSTGGGLVDVENLDERTDDFVDRRTGHEVFPDHRAGTADRHVLRTLEIQDDDLAVELAPTDAVLAQSV